jgi:hypothetical protein
MGDALVVLTVPEEVFMQGDRVKITITRDDVWQLPAEPREIEKSRSRKSDHTHAVARSLEKFLNERLGRLHRMVRTGWWILDLVKVQVCFIQGVD